jgi:HEAT repeat protein
MDARAAAPEFLRLAATADPDLGDLIETALARWDYAAARDLWLARIDQPPPHRRGVLVAAACLGTVREGRAAPRLRELALSLETTPPLRLAAARALGEIRTSGSESDAMTLSKELGSAGRNGRLAAALLLLHHEGSDTVRLLTTLAGDPEPAVSRAAVTRLSELGSQYVLAVLKEARANEGAEVRALAVAAMIQTPSDEHVRLLAGILKDVHPDVRARARRGLADLAVARGPLVLEQAMSVLNQSDWRGQEQAAILLATLDHKPAARRMVALLKTGRSEVAVAVGWGLRRLAVSDTLPAVLKHVQDRHATMPPTDPSGGAAGVSLDALDRQLSQLVQFLGEARYEPADPALRELVPRILQPGTPPQFRVQPVFTRVRPETRAAAVWALGLLKEKKPDPPLIELIEGRLTGDGAYGRDDSRVRRMAAVSLGRMKANQSLPALRLQAENARPSTDIVVNAARWAVNRMTQEPVPQLGVIESIQADWFLIPER